MFVMTYDFYFLHLVHHVCLCATFCCYFEYATPLCPTLPFGSFKDQVDPDMHVMIKNVNFKFRESWVLSMFLPSCMVLRESVNFSELQFLPL